MTFRYMQTALETKYMNTSNIYLPVILGLLPEINPLTYIYKKIIKLLGNFAKNYSFKYIAIFSKVGYYDLVNMIYSVMTIIYQQI